jgi:putative ABC transport system substrate-binding protein
MAINIRRREFVAALGSAAAWPLAARAQQPAKRIGFLSSGSQSHVRTDFFDGLREFGFVEGQNLAVEYRFAIGRFDALDSLAQDLADLKPDVIVTTATPAAKAAQKATGTIPIVIIDPGDPVETGLVASLARPGGNITGQSSIAPELAGKRLQLLKETVPSISRVAMMWNSPIQPAEVALKELRAAAATLRIEIIPVEIQGEQEIDGAFATMARERANGLLVFQDPVMTNNAKLIVDLINKNRVPTMFWDWAYVRIGGLMSYGPSYPDMFHRGGNYVGRILKGAKPADLPVEQPDRFYLVINLENRQGTWPRCAVISTAPCRRGDRIDFAAMHMAANGTRRRKHWQPNVRSWRKKLT